MSQQDSATLSAPAPPPAGKRPPLIVLSPWGETRPPLRTVGRQQASAKCGQQGAGTAHLSAQCAAAPWLRAVLAQGWGGPAQDGPWAGQLPSEERKERKRKRKRGGAVRLPSLQRGPRPAPRRATGTFLSPPFGGKAGARSCWPWGLPGLVPRANPWRECAPHRFVRLAGWLAAWLAARRTANRYT
eukprot:scaffold162_cov474-Prasinococcus_capsulatus_cf.AAC.2